MRGVLKIQNYETVEKLQTFEKLSSLLQKTDKLYRHATNVNKKPSYPTNARWHYSCNYMHVNRDKRL